MKFDFDLIIIGTGAGGSVGAHYAAALGKEVAIFEKAEVGGECPNFACVPTKAILHAADVYQTIKSSEFYGTNVGKITLDYERIKRWKNIVVSRTGAAHGEESFKDDKIKLIKAKAHFISEHEVSADGKVYSASKFLIATGSATFIPSIPGLNESGFITFKEAVDFSSLPKSIFILGGGPIGCEFAEIFNSFESRVIIGDTAKKLMAKEDPETSELLQALFEFRGIKVLTGIEVIKVEKEGSKKIIYYKKDNEQHQAEVDEILIAAGKKPVLDFDLQKAGLILDKEHLITDQYLQTNVLHIYAAGDVVGPYLFTHTGYYQSYIAVNNMFSRKKIKQSFRALPRCVFTNPEIASVGLSETQAKEMGIKTKKGLCAISILGRANTSNELDGFVKVITDEKERIIGGAIVAPNAGEMIHELALAIQLKVKAQVISDMLHVYPTFSEGIKIACSSLE